MHLRAELQLLHKVCFAATALLFSLCPLSPPSYPHLIAQRRSNGAQTEVRDNRFWGVTHPRNNSTVSAAVSPIKPFITTNLCRTGWKKNLLEGSVIEGSASRVVYPVQLLKLCELKLFFSKKNIFVQQTAVWGPWGQQSWGQQSGTREGPPRVAFRPRRRAPSSNHIYFPHRFGPARMRGSFGAVCLTAARPVCSPKWRWRAQTHKQRQCWGLPGTKTQESTVANQNERPCGGRLHGGRRAGGVHV